MQETTLWSVSYTHLDVYKRQGNESMTEQDFARCEAYLRFVFSAISENEDQKGWKKIRKCCIVDEVMNKKKKVR